MGFTCGRISTFRTPPPFVLSTLAGCPGLSVCRAPCPVAWRAHWRSTNFPPTEPTPTETLARAHSLCRSAPQTAVCRLCDQAAASGHKAPSTPPPLITYARGRKRTIDSQNQFCPDLDCSYYGWLGRGNIRANGHPGGNPWRQFQCVSCLGYFHQRHGTPLHGKHVSIDKLVWAVGALAEGLGIRAVARVFEVRSEERRVGKEC